MSVLVLFHCNLEVMELEREKGIDMRNRKGTVAVFVCTE